MTPKDATDEKPMDDATRAAWVSFREEYDLHIRNPTAVARLAMAAAAFKRGQAIERARVCRELRELQSQFRARVVDVYKGQGHHDAGMRDGLTLAANRMDDLLNEIEAA